MKIVVINCIRCANFFFHGCSSIFSQMAIRPARSGYIIGLVTPVIGPSKSKKLTVFIVPAAQFLIITQRGITASSFGRHFLESIVWYGMIIECYYSIYATDLLYSVEL